jgi:hypothetical protein
MTLDDKNRACSDSDLIGLAAEFHSLYLAHGERLIELVVQWHEEHLQKERRFPRQSMEFRVLPLPQRDLSLPEKAACLAAIHDTVWKGELINPFSTVECVRGIDFLDKKEADREFRQLTQRVLAIPVSDLWFLNRHLDSVKNALIAGRDKEHYPTRNDLWCRWFEENGWTDAEIRDRWNLMADEERKSVDSRGSERIDAGPQGAETVKKARTRRGVKRKKVND